MWEEVARASSHVLLCPWSRWATDADAVRYVYSFCTEAQDPAVDAEIQTSEQSRADPA
jgi:hypothetical protein